MSDAETTPPGTRSARLEAVLRQAFHPTDLSVVDESALHAGHSGARAGGQTHYAITIVSAAFEGLKRVDRSRLVHATLVDEFASGLHAVSLSLKTANDA